jgi:hypothetical protein
MNDVRYTPKRLEDNIIFSEDIATINEIVEKMMLEGSDKKREQYTIIARIWLDDIPSTIVDYMYTDKFVDKHNKTILQTRLSMVKLRKEFNHKYLKNGKQKSWFDWFHSNYPLWHEEYKGNSIKKKHTEVLPAMVYLLKKYKHHNPAVTVARHKEVVDGKYTTDQDENPTREHYEPFVKVDIKSLDDYIEGTMKTVDNRHILKQIDDKNPKDVGYYFKLLANIMAAVKLRKYTEYFRKDKNNIEYLNTFKERREIVRIPTDTFTGPTLHRYYSYGSIQWSSLPKAVRNAALGYYFEIDLYAGAFAWYRHQVDVVNEWAKKNGKDQYKFDTHSIDFMLQHKASFRKQIAAECFQDIRTTDEHKIAIAKSAMTSLTFGAELDDCLTGYKKAIAKKITHTKSRLRFNRNKHIISIVALRGDLEDAIEIMYAKEIKIHKKNKEFCDKRGVFKVKKMMASMYFEYETKVINVLRDDIITQTNNKHSATNNDILLHLHDALFVRHNPDHAWMNVLAQTVNEYQTVSVDNRKPYVDMNTGNAAVRRAAYSDRNLEHEAFIQAEQLRAEEIMFRKSLKNNDLEVSNENHSVRYAERLLDICKSYSYNEYAHEADGQNAHVENDITLREQYQLESGEMDIADKDSYGGMYDGVVTNKGYSNGNSTLSYEYLAEFYKNSTEK